MNAEDDIFDDFDQRMYRAVMYDPWLDFSFYDGLTGYGRYWISRLHQQASSVQSSECLSCICKRIEEKLPDISTNEQTDVYCFLHDLCQIQDFEMCANLLEKLKIQSADFSRFDKSSFGNMVRICHYNRYFNGDLKDTALKQIPDLDMEKPPSSMGLLSGYAGEGMLRLMTLDQTNMSWMQFL